MWDAIKAEYLFRPSQLLKRLRLSSAMRTQVVRLPWGHPIRVNPQDSIGQALVTLGVYDLPVTEVLWRLIDPTDVCVDAGANIGCMTSVMLAKIGNNGSVHSFEPHPKLFKQLEAHTLHWQNGQKGQNSQKSNGSLRLYPLALSNREGSASLEIPDSFLNNQGTARLGKPGQVKSDQKNTQGIVVPLTRLDHVFSDLKLIPQVLKIDVEGSEAQVVEGAGALIGEKGIRDVIYEDHGALPNPLSLQLESQGYQLFRIARALLGPKLLPPETNATGWEPANYLATRKPERALRRIQPRGWQCLKKCE